MKACVALLGAVLLGLTQAPAGRDVARDPDLLKGVDEVKAGDFKSAVLSLEAAIRRLGRGPSQPRELTLAFVYQGVAYLEMDEETLAKEKFRQALLLEPSLRLDASAFSPSRSGSLRS